MRLICYFSFEVVDAVPHKGMKFQTDSLNLHMTDDKRKPQDCKDFAVHKLFMFSSHSWNWKKKRHAFLSLCSLSYSMLARFSLSIHLSLFEVMLRNILCSSPALKMVHFHGRFNPHFSGSSRGVDAIQDMEHCWFWG